MIHVIRSEWIKFRSVRSTIITLGLAAGIVVLIALLSVNDANSNESYTCEPVTGPTTTTLPTDDPFGSPCGEGFEAVVLPTTTHLTDVTSGVTIAALIFGTLGVQIIGQEYRFNTIRPTFTAVPDRRKVLVAKLVVIALSTAAVAFAMTLACWAIGSTLADVFTMGGDDRRLLWSIPLFAALWSMAGLGVGAIVRQPIAGILILLGEAFVAENLVGAIIDGSARWLPFINGIQMTLAEGDGGGDLRPLFEGGVYFAVVCFSLFVIGLLLADRRDA